MAILTKQSCEILSIGASTIDGMKRVIELSRRTCYKSLDKITPDSTEKFVNHTVRSNHLAMCEHGTIYLKIPILETENNNFVVNRYKNNKYSFVKIYDNIEYAFVTTNYRVIIENEWGNDLKFRNL